MQQVEQIDVEPVDVRRVLDHHGIDCRDANPVDVFLGWLLPGLEAGGRNLILGGAGSRVLVALRREPLALESVLRWHFGVAAGGQRPAGGFWPESACWVAGVLSYDDLAAQGDDGDKGDDGDEGDDGDDGSGWSSSACWGVLGGLVVNRDRSQVTLHFTGSSGGPAQDLRHIDEALERARGIGASPEIVADVTSEIEGNWQAVAGRGQVFQACESREQYLSKAAQVLELILDGQFYQLNLLRFFDSRGHLPAGWGTTRLLHAGGCYSALIDIEAADVTGRASEATAGSRRIMSFSPEKFVSIAGGSRLVETWPVKGTAPRSNDPEVDARNAEELMTSAKDLAELHMIVDLMRNDFHRICRPGSVRVPVTHGLQSHANVHHLHAHVTGHLNDHVCLADVLAAVSPAGSITGAPKIEVMKWIRELEGRPRGYHMGNVFLMDPTGAFDSSVMIRTIVRSDDVSGSVPCYHRYDLAVGSGIVVNSTPESELAEIEAKAAIVTADLQKLRSGIQD